MEDTTNHTPQDTTDSGHGGNVSQTRLSIGPQASSALTRFLDETERAATAPGGPGLLRPGVGTVRLVRAGVAAHEHTLADHPAHVPGERVDSEVWHIMDALDNDTAVKRMFARQVRGLIPGHDRAVMNRLSEQRAAGLAERAAARRKARQERARSQAQEQVEHQSTKALPEHSLLSRPGMGGRTSSNPQQNSPRLAYVGSVPTSPAALDAVTAAPQWAAQHHGATDPWA